MELTIRKCSMCDAKLECDVNIGDKKYIDIPSVVCASYTNNQAWSN